MELMNREAEPVMVTSTVSRLTVDLLYIKGTGPYADCGAFGCLSFELLKFVGSVVNEGEDPLLHLGVSLPSHL